MEGDCNVYALITVNIRMVYKDLTNVDLNIKFRHTSKLFEYLFLTSLQSLMIHN